jgi:hypothetical protein
MPSNFRRCHAEESASVNYGKSWLVASGVSAWVWTLERNSHGLGVGAGAL